jgi:hypothetical protein
VFWLAIHAPGRNDVRCWGLFRIHSFWWANNVVNHLGRARLDEIPDIDSILGEAHMQSVFVCDGS